MEQVIFITLVTQTCGECGIVFGMEEEYRNKLVRTNGSFYKTERKTHWSGTANGM